MTYDSRNIDFAYCHCTQHFLSDIFPIYMRWYLKYPLFLRNLEEMMAERGLSVAHTTIMRWVNQYIALGKKDTMPHVNAPTDDELDLVVDRLNRYAIHAVSGRK